MTLTFEDIERAQQNMEPPTGYSKMVITITVELESDRPLTYVKWDMVRNRILSSIPTSYYGTDEILPDENISSHASISTYQLSLPWPL